MVYVYVSNPDDLFPAKFFHAEIDVINKVINATIISRAIEATDINFAILKFNPGCFNVIELTVQIQFSIGQFFVYYQTTTASRAIWSITSD